MIRFSARRAVPLAILLGIVLVPMWYGRLGPEEDECPSDAAVLDAAALDPRLELILEGPKATKIEARRLLARLP